jgi:hypothetical protein
VWDNALGDPRFLAVKPYAANRVPDAPGSPICIRSP